MELRPVERRRYIGLGSWVRWLLHLSDDQSGCSLIGTSSIGISKPPTTFKESSLRTRSEFTPN